MRSRLSFVILICPFDPFKMNRRKYTFRNICVEDNDLELNDGATKIFLNSSGTDGEVSEELQNFLDYVNGKMPKSDDLIKDMDAAVKKARMNKEWRREYMTLVLDVESNMLSLAWFQKSSKVWVSGNAGTLFSFLSGHVRQGGCS